MPEGDRRRFGFGSLRWLRPTVICYVTMCEHLQALEKELISCGITETFRGQAWSRNCREWVYFMCHLDLVSIRSRLSLPACVVDHVNDDPKSGTEQGFCCEEHFDGIIGRREASPGYPTIS
jgi:hypothetical protein